MRTLPASAALSLATHVSRWARLLTVFALAVAIAVAPFHHPSEAQAGVPSDDPRILEVLAQDEALEYLGRPVSTKIGSPAATGIENGRHVSYQLFKGAPDTDYPPTFTVTDIETGERLRTCESPTAEHTRNLTLANDGRVYWGTYYDSKLWRYDPATGACEDLGLVDPDDERRADSFGIAAGPDGTVYLGVYPDSRLYLYDPATEQAELLGELDPDADYIHGIAYHEASDTVFVSTGGQVPKLWSIADGGRGEQTLLVDETTAPGINARSPFISRLDIVGDRVFGKVGANILVVQLDGTIDHWDAAQTNYYGGYHVIDGAEPGTALFTSGRYLISYDVASREFTETRIDIGANLSHAVVDDSSGTPLLYGTTVGGVFVADLAAGTRESFHPVDFQQPTLIQKLFTGPDNTVWASGYMVGLTQIDKTGQDHGATLTRGQYESAVVRDGKMYLGAYGNATLNVLDPATYDPSRPATVRPLLDGQEAGQDRPFGIAYSEDRDEIYLGAVGKYGQTQGGLAIWDGATGEHEWLTSEIGADENVVSLAYDEAGGLLYLGTTVDGGLGSAPSGNTAGKLIVLDPETRTVVSRIDPAGAEREGVTGLMIADDGQVWGVAEEALFAYDPVTGTSTVEGTIGRRYTADTTYWANANLSQSAADGRIYVTARGQFSAHDPTDGTTTPIATGMNWSVADDSGNVYVSVGADLFRYNVPGAEDPGNGGPAEQLVNPGFEDGAPGTAVPGWGPDGTLYPDTSYAVTSDVSHTGQHSLHLVDDSPTRGVAIGSGRVAVAPGAEYAAGAMVAVGQGRASIYLRFYDKAGVRLTNDATGVSANDGQFEAVRVTQTAPEGAASATVVIATSTANLGSARVDDITLAPTTDEVAPELEVSLSPDVLERANHRYVDVSATVSASDDSGQPPTVELVSVESNEPDDGHRDGSTVDDIVINDEHTFRLRAEHSTAGDGRVYTVTYRATDAAGNSTVTAATVSVPLHRDR